MNDFMDWGKLLYDESNQKNVIREKERSIREYFYFSLFFSSILLFGFVVVIISSITTGFTTREVIVIILALMLSFWPIILFQYFWYNRTVDRNLKIYENGILLTWNTIKQAKLPIEKRFVYFKDIKEVYLNINKYLPYVVIKGNNIGKKFIAKRDIYDFNKFVKILKEKTNVIEIENLEI